MRNVKISIAAPGVRNSHSVKERELSWEDLKNLLGSVKRDAGVTMSQYLGMTREEQTELKASAGAITGGVYVGGKRKENNLKSRDLILLDFDRITDPSIMDLIKEGKLPGDWPWLAFAHTTRKHQPHEPKVRIIVPLSRPVLPAEFRPLVRHVARVIDGSPSIHSMDEASEKWNQLMFLPTCASDAEFVAREIKGAVLDPDKILAMTRETDTDRGHDRTAYLIGEVPQRTRVSRAPGAPRAASSGSDDPRARPGVSGAFCRAYDVESAITKFIPEIYVPGEGGRWTFTGGSNANGLAILGDHAYSHHESDPYHGRAMSAFDVVRLHKFGEMDGEADADGTPYPQLPSFRAMAELALGDELVRREMREADFRAEKPRHKAMTDRPDDAVARELEEMMDDIDIDKAIMAEIAGHAATEEDFTAYLEPRVVKGDLTGYMPTAYNATVILSNDKRTRGAIALDEFTGMIRIAQDIDLGIRDVPVIRTRPNGAEWTDEAEAAISTWLAAPIEAGGYGMTLTQRDLIHAITNSAAKNAYHPIKRMIEAETWDGTPRLADFLSTHLRVAPNAYHREVSRLMFTAAVARLYEPGLKFDFIPVIEGTVQGGRKSTFVEVISLGYFGEIKSKAVLNDEKKLIEQTQEAWFVEIPELAAVCGNDNNILKAVISSKTDRARAAYGRNAESRLRQMIFVGTTNNRKYLTDPTGGRRFWPIVTQTSDRDPIDIDAVRGDLKQLYAEALVEYRKMREAQPRHDLPLYLTGTAAETARALQGAAQVESIDDSLTGMVQEILETPISTRNGRERLIEIGGQSYRSRFCLKQIHDELFKDGSQAYDRRSSTLLSEAIGKVPYVISSGKVAMFEGFGKQREYVISKPLLEDELKAREAAERVVELPRAMGR